MVAPIDLRHLREGDPKVPRNQEAPAVAFLTNIRTVSDPTKEIDEKNIAFRKFREFREK